MEAESNNWDALKGEMETSLRGVLVQLAQGAASDLDAYVRAISASMIVAVQRKDAARVAELKLQLRALAEVHKISALQGVQNTAWGTMGKVLDLVFGIATKALVVA